jgi:phage-related holin
MLTLIIISMIATKVHFDLKAVFIAGAITLTGLMAYIEQYMFGDMARLHILVLLVLVDFVTGICKSWVQGLPITSKKFRDSIGKVVQYGAFLIVTNLLVGVSVMGEHLSNPKGLITFSYMALILTECLSIYENVVAINPKLAFVRQAVERFKSVIKEKSNGNN